MKPQSLMKVAPEFVDRVLRLFCRRRISYSENPIPANYIILDSAKRSGTYPTGPGSAAGSSSSPTWTCHLKSVTYFEILFNKPQELLNDFFPVSIWEGMSWSILNIQEFFKLDCVLILNQVGDFFKFIQSFCRAMKHNEVHDI